MGMEYGSVGEEILLSMLRSQSSALKTNKIE